MSHQPSYLFGHYHPSQENLYTHMLYLIQAHPTYKCKVNEFIQFLSRPYQSQQIIKMGSLIYALLLPDFPKTAHRRLAVQLLQSVQLSNVDSEITYTNISDYLLKICSNCIENIDLKSVLAFLTLAKKRITDLFIIDIHDPNFKEKITYSLKINIHDPQQVLQDCHMNQKKINDEIKHIYYTQVQNQNIPENVPAHRCIIRQLKKKHEQIIPLGYVYEQLMHDLVNCAFELKSHYKLKGNKKVNAQKIEYYAEIANMNTIRDKIVNQQVFKNVFVLSGEILETFSCPGKDFLSFRLNLVFGRQNYFQRVKQVKGNQYKYFNILSEFYDRDQFNIDEETLTKQKVKTRRHEHQLGITGKQTIRKPQVDYDNEIRNIGLKVAQNITKFLDQERFQTGVKAMATALKTILQQDKNINSILQKKLSKFQQLPKDNEDPFMDDVSTLAALTPLQILLFGKPKSGKTTLSKNIAQKYNLVYVSVQSVIDKVFERQKFFEQNPPQADEDGNVKDGLTNMEKYILEELTKGNRIQDQDILDLINNELQSQAVLNKGFILDLPLQYNKFWSKAIINNKLYTPKIQCRFFSHIIQIQQSEQQWKHFSEGVLQKPDDLKVSSAFDRYLITKPKPPLEEGEQQVPVDDQEKPVPLIENNLIKTITKQSDLPIIDHLTQHIHMNNFIKIKNAYQSIDECLKLLQHNLYKIPLAKKIQGAQKQLLTVGFQQNKLARKWSPWLLVDSVQLYNGKLIMGKFQFAAEYAGRVFVFENENNLNAFLALPRKFTQKKPELPAKTNICIVGPRKSGKKTIAKMLAEIYKLKIINLQQIIGRVLAFQRNFEQHVPSNPEKRSNSVHLSEQQWKQFCKGNLLNAKEILPIVLYNLGLKLQKKPPGWGIQKTQEQAGQEQTQQKKPPPKKTTKKKQAKGDDDRPKTPPIEDLPLKEVIPQLNFKGKIDDIRGFIIIGYPNNQQQLAALKLFNIPIDKLIILSDNNEEAPNKTLQKRLNEAQIQQVAIFTAAIGPVKQALGQEVCKQFQIDKTPAQIVNKIRQFMDPFYLKCDQDSINRVLADKQQDGDPIPSGFCGDYCPVILNQGWLIKGKEQFEAGVQGKRFRISGEKQINQFKQNPQKFIKQSKNKQIPPRVMFMGIRGVGLRTQLMKFNEKYKIPILSLKDTLIQHLDNEKLKRKNDRYYNKGFKIPQFDQQGNQVQDPQLNQQSPDFNKRQSQIDTIRTLFNGIQEVAINANFYDVDQSKVQTNLVQLLTQARRLPQVIIMLICDENKWLERVLDKTAVEKELQDIKQKRRQQKQKERQEARRKAQEDGEEYQQPPEQQQDPQIPKLDQMIAQKQEGLKGQRQADLAKIQQFTEAFKALNIQVITIKCQRSPKHVTDRINTALSPYLDNRNIIKKWERNQMLPIQRHRAGDFINNYIALDSRFGKLNPFTLMRPVLPYPLIYKERIYYLKDEEQRDYVMRNPQVLNQNSPIPPDVRITPIIFVIGKTKTGKTSLCHSLSKNLGIITLSIKDIIDQFTKDHRDNQIEKILSELKSGKTLSDEMIIQLIQKRTSLDDCQTYGWILDGLPNNIKQCQLLNKKGIIPSQVISLQLSDYQVKKRALKDKNNLYDWDLEVIESRLKTNRESQLEVQAYYLTKYNNLKLIEGQQSKWGIFQTSRRQILKTIKSNKQFARSVCTRTPASGSRIGLSSNCILANLSDYAIFCPASYKLKRQYIRKCPRHHENLALFKKKIYLLNSQKQLKDFIQNPDVYINQGSAFKPPIQIYTTSLPQASKKFENKGYCMVELTRKKLIKGNPVYSLKYKEKYYSLGNPNNMKLFIKNPTQFQMATLPDKLPVQFEKKSELKKIAKKNDCTAFLQHHLSNILMRCLAQLGYRRPKYPTLGSKESALKFLSIALKATNPNKDDQYRQKYSEKLKIFIKQSNYSQQIRDELKRKEKGGSSWQQTDEQNLLKLCEQYNEFLEALNHSDKHNYFEKFIR